MAQLLPECPRFTPAEWHLNNQWKMKNAERERSLAEQLVDESQRLQQETKTRTQRTLGEVNKKFSQRVGDISYWRGELSRRLHEVKDELEAILAYKLRLKHGLAACSPPLHTGQQCLTYRENRQGIDLVHDDVQAALLKEVSCIKGIQELLLRTQERAAEQTRLLRKVKYHLEKDLGDKEASLSIDTVSASLTTHSQVSPRSLAIQQFDVSKSTPQQWCDFTIDNLEKATAEISCSVQLRSLVDGILSQTAADLRRQCRDTDQAFAQRIRETKAAKHQLEDQHAKLVAEVMDMEKNISQLTEAVEEKKPALALAQTRLAYRATRPNVELCRDDVHRHLLFEVQQIQGCIRSLRQQIEQAQLSMKRLLQTKMQLVEDINVKDNSLLVDEVQCVGLRQAISIQTF